MLNTRMRQATAVAAITLLGLPSTALAMPVRDGLPPDTEPSGTTTLIREVPAEGAGQTLALIMSGAALLVAAGAAVRTVSLRPAMAGPAAPTSPRRGGPRGR